MKPVNSALIFTAIAGFFYFTPAASNDTEEKPPEELVMLCEGIRGMLLKTPSGMWYCKAPDKEIDT